MGVVECRRVAPLRSGVVGRLNAHTDGSGTVAENPENVTEATGEIPESGCWMEDAERCTGRGPSLFNVGDAVANKNIHSVVVDSPRLCVTRQVLRNRRCGP